MPARVSDADMVGHSDRFDTAEPQASPVMFFNSVSFENSEEDMKP
jgi:hypothetical protein